jgi:hypothetical protein
MKWIDIKEHPPPIDWDVLIKGIGDADDLVYDVVRYFKPSQQGYPGFESRTCDCEFSESRPLPVEDRALRIEVTHWCAMSDLNRLLSG